jgi:hypothetical protein
MNVFQLRGMDFIPGNVKPDIDRESDAETYSWGETVYEDVIFKKGDTLTLDNFINTFLRQG